MRKLGAGLLLLLLLTFPLPAPAEESAPAGALEEQLQALDLREIQAYLDEIDRQVGEYLPDLSVEHLLDGIRRGELDFGWRDWWQGLGRYLFRELLVGSRLLGQLLVLAVVAAVLNNLQAAFARGNTGRLARAVVYLALLGLAMGSFTMAVDAARGAVDQMVSFFQALLPLLMSLLVAVGGVATAGLMHPFTVLLVGVLSTLTRNVIFPLIYLGAVLGVVNEVSPRFQVSRLSGLLKQVAVVLLGACLVIFTGALALQGVAGPVADSITLKAAKFLTGSFIPIVGKMLGDSLELVAGTTLLLKNAITLVGVLGILALAVFPAVKILVLVVIYRLAAALAQPLGDEGISRALDSMGNSLTMVFAVLAGVGLMFFFALAITVGVGNMTVMLR